VTLTCDPLTLKLVHRVLVSQGPFLPSLVFVGLFVFPLDGGTEQTDRQTDGQDQHMMGPPSRKDGPIIRYTIYTVCSVHYTVISDIKAEWTAHTWSTTGLPSGRSGIIVMSEKLRTMFWMMKSTVLQANTLNIAACQWNEIRWSNGYGFNFQSGCNQVVTTGINPTFHPSKMFTCIECDPIQ